MAPTIIEGGTKINVIPDIVELAVDIRTLPGPDERRRWTRCGAVLGDLADRVEYVPIRHDEPTASPTDTPLWDCLSRVTQQWYPGSETVPYLTVGATDARFFRRARRARPTGSGCSANG